MHVTPFGACGTVTGSCHLATSGDTGVILDCGLYQGEHERRNAAAFGFDAAAAAAAVVTHAHLDHIGRLPQLVSDGFSGPVLATPATLQLMEPMLDDALKVMTEDRRRAKKGGRPMGPPSWQADDLDRLRDLFIPLDYYSRHAIGSLTVELKNAGHLPGSAFVQLEGDDKRLIYSGDLGNRRKEVLPDLDYAAPADLVLTESTYGDRNHKPLQETLDEFATLVDDVLRSGGKVIIPSFALERTQELLFYIRALEREGRIPAEPVFLDSPLAIEVTRLYASLREEFGLKVRRLFDRGVDPFRPKHLTITKHVEDSKRINYRPGPATIIAGSGMIAGGRIMHHLIHHLGDERSCIIIVGFQPRGGIGRQLVDGRSTIRIWGRDHNVDARVATIGGFSGHAGRDQLLDWLSGQPRVALVHGEDTARGSIADELTKRDQEPILGVAGSPIDV